MNKSAAIVGVGLSLASFFSVAQTPEMPKRKPGQWEIRMESSMMPGMGTLMEQCIDEKTDAEMQKRSLQGGGKSDCKLTSSKKAASGWEYDSICKQDKTTITSHSVVSGDFSSAYKMDSTATFDPPLLGMKEMKSTMNVRYLGACKAGMLPGDISMNGVKINQAASAEGKAAKMSAEDIKKMMEAMQKQAQ